MTDFPHFFWLAISVMSMFFEAGGFAQNVAPRVSPGAAKPPALATPLAHSARRRPPKRFVPPPPFTQQGPALICEPPPVLDFQVPSVLEINAVVARYFPISPRPYRPCLLSRSPLQADAYLQLARTRGTVKAAETILYYQRSRKSSDSYVFPVEISMFVSSRLLPTIARTGFLNIHQTRGKTGGLPAVELRRYVESRLVDLDLADLENDPVLDSLRPKYALLHPLREVPTRSNAGQLKKYGDAVAIFRDEVKWRATATPYDSLDTLRYGSARGIATAYDISFPVYAMYLEAQIWGALDLADVSEIRLPLGSSADQVEQVRRLGVDVSFYERELLQKYEWKASEFPIHRVGSVLQGYDPARSELLAKWRKRIDDRAGCWDR